VVYKELVREREYIVSITGDLAVASALDRSIIAVAEVIRACDRRREIIATDTGDTSRG
jgi:hypothetical protein